MAGMLGTPLWGIRNIGMGFGWSSLLLSDRCFSSRVNNNVEIHVCCFDAVTYGSTVIDLLERTLVLVAWLALFE